jgi:5-methylcytosine-specific restriction endonuclease McrA
LQPDRSGTPPLFLYVILEVYGSVNMRKSEHHCVVCGNPCEKHIYKRQKIKDNGKIEWSINLHKLAQRDKNICHICGQKVDMNADNNDASYGSIDHVIPISKGGTHTWNNIKLAHRGCNTMKSNKMVKVLADGQLSLYV